MIVSSAINRPILLRKSISAWLICRIGPTSAPGSTSLIWVTTAPMIGEQYQVAYWSGVILEGSRPCRSALRLESGSTSALTCTRSTPWDNPNSVWAAGRVTKIWSSSNPPVLTRPTIRKRMVRSSTCAVNSSPICQFFCEASFTPTIAEPGSSSLTHSPCTCHQGAVVLTPVWNVASASTFLVVAKPVRIAAPFGRVRGLSNQVPIKTRVSPSTCVRAVR